MTKEEKKLAKIWCELNRWNWPEELNHTKPNRFDELNMITKYEIVYPMMSLIQMQIGVKLCLEEWRKQMDRNNQTT